MTKTNSNTKNFLNFDVTIKTISQNKKEIFFSVDSSNLSKSHDFPLSDKQITELLLTTSEISQSKENPQSKLVELGQALYDSIFQKQLISIFKKTYNNASYGEKILRIRLLLDEGKLMRLPWELMNDGREFIGLKIPISRMVPYSSRRHLPKLNYPLRILVIIASPLDLEQKGMWLLDFEQEQELILKGLESLIEQKKIEVDFIEDASFTNIKRYILKKEYHIIHYSGYGEYNDEKDKNYLLFEDDNGNSNWVDSEQFSYLLAQSEATRLVVLSSSQTARVSQSDYLSSIPFKLIQQNIYALVGFQLPVFDKTANIFSRDFYHCLAERFPVDLALLKARQKLANTISTNSIDWANPILFSRDFDGQLFEFDDALAKEDFGKRNFYKPGIIGDFTSAPIFIGRRKELRQLRQALLSSVKKVIIIYGLGGIGKTSLALKAVDSIQDEFNGIISISCSSIISAEQLLMQLNGNLMILGITDFNKVFEKESSLEDKIVRFVQLLKCRKIIIVFDAFDAWLNDHHDIADEKLRFLIQKLLEGISGEAKIIITSRYRLKSNFIKSIKKVFELQLGELTFPETIKLLNRYEKFATLDRGNSRYFGRP